MRPILSFETALFDFEFMLVEFNEMQNPRIVHVAATMVALLTRLFRYL